MLGADVGLFYYAGHGVQVRGENYLVPVSANPEREADVDFEMLNTSLVMRQMEGASTRLNLILLDACRNNPFGGRGLRATSRGLAQMTAPEGTLISFATQPGNVASDSEDRNSPYTKALAETMRRPGLGLFDVFNEVGLEVKKQTAPSSRGCRRRRSLAVSIFRGSQGQSLFHWQWHQRQPRNPSRLRQPWPRSRMRRSRFGVLFKIPPASRCLSGLSGSSRVHFVVVTVVLRRRILI